MQNHKDSNRPGGFDRFKTLWFKFIRGLAFIVAVWLLLEVFHITFDTFSRYVFSKPFQGTITISIMMLMFLVYLGAAYCENVRAHIRVDILFRRFSKHWRSRLDVIWLVLALSLMPLLIWQTFLLALHSYRTGEMAMDIALPVYPGKFVISIGFALWAVQLVVSIIEKIKGEGN